MLGQAPLLKQFANFISTENIQENRRGNFIFLREGALLELLSPILPQISHVGPTDVLAVECKCHMSCCPGSPEPAPEASTPQQASEPRQRHQGGPGTRFSAGATASNKAVWASGGAARRGPTAAGADDERHMCMQKHLVFTHAGLEQGFRAHASHSTRTGELSLPAVMVGSFCFDTL